MSFALTFATPSSGGLYTTENALVCFGANLLRPRDDKRRLSVVSVNSVSAAKTFLNSTDPEPPLMVNGPFGLGGTHRPITGHRYSPPRLGRHHEHALNCAGRRRWVQRHLELLFHPLRTRGVRGSSRRALELPGVGLERARVLRLIVEIMRELLALVSAELNGR